MDPLREQERRQQLPLRHFEDAVFLGSLLEPSGTKLTAAASSKGFLYQKYLHQLCVLWEADQRGVKLNSEVLMQIKGGRWIKMIRRSPFVSFCVCSNQIRQFISRSSKRRHCSRQHEAPFINVKHQIGL